MRIVFMGTPDFAVPSLNALLERGHEILAVYTQPDKKRQWHTTLKCVSRRHLKIMKTK